MSDNATPVLRQQPTSPKIAPKLIRVVGTILLTISTGSFIFGMINVRVTRDSFQASPPTSRSPQEADLSRPDSPLAPAQQTVERELKSYVTHLAEKIGERNLRQHKKLCEAADFIEAKFIEFGYQPKRQKYEVNGLDCYNIDVEIKGTLKPDEIVIIGGHYDSALGTPGANDNGSGTAAMLVLANHFKKHQPQRTLRFVAWTNEEPPYFQRRDLMGSWVYAEKCRQDALNIQAVLSLETMGYYTDEKDSQKYPEPLNLMYPSTGNFVG
ncbi:MAG: M28 family peptidase, partial [Mariniblastus sp.]|nr:M28 family peptidase [Mariniblastus sp.]